MPDSEYFQKIRTAIRTKKAISATYNEMHRELIPHILGRSPKPGSAAGTNRPEDFEETVLCYQYLCDVPAGRPPEVEPRHPSPKNWRCFKVAKLKNVDVIAPGIPANQQTPPNYGTRNRQNNVVTDKEERTG